jgi:hypothetical protein
MSRRPFCRRRRPTARTPSPFSEMLILYIFSSAYTEATGREVKIRCGRDARAQTHRRKPSGRGPSLARRGSGSSRKWLCLLRTTRSRSRRLAGRYLR